MNLDSALLYLMASGGPSAVEAAVLRGMHRDMMSTGGHRSGFDLIVGQAVESKTTPSPEDVCALLGDVASETSLSLSWVCEHIHKRAKFARIAKANDSLRAMIEANDVDGAESAILSLAGSLSAQTSDALVPTNIFSLGQKVWEQYELSKSGVTTVPFPWQKLNDMTMGMAPGTNTWFAARPGVGKTWLQVILAHHLWKVSSGKAKKLSVLIVSPEMLKVQLAERLFTIAGGFSYGDVVSGQLGVYGEAAFKKVIADLKDEVGISIVDATDNLTPPRIESAIEACEADVVAVDSAYRIKWLRRAADRSENLAEGAHVISSWSKRTWSNDRKISALAFSQLGRGADKKGGNTQDAVALTDTLLWEGDNLFFLEQDADMKSDKVMDILTRKCRRQAAHVDRVRVNWDFQKSDFTEKDYAQKKFKDVPDGFDASDF